MKNLVNGIKLVEETLLSTNRVNDFEYISPFWSTFYQKIFERLLQYSCHEEFLFKFFDNMVNKRDVLKMINLYLSVFSSFLNFLKLNSNCLKIYATLVVKLIFYLCLFKMTNIPLSFPSTNNSANRIV